MTKTTAKDFTGRPVKQSVSNCARCGFNHDLIEFKPMPNSSAFTHWGMCPNTESPILMQVVDDDKKAPRRKKR